MEAILTLHLFFIIHIHVRLQHHADWKPFHQLVVITLIPKRWFEDLGIPSSKKEWDEMWREADKGLFKLSSKELSHFTCQNLSNAPKHVLNHARRLLANAANASQIRLDIRFHNLLVHLKVARNLGDCMVKPEISSCIKKNLTFNSHFGKCGKSSHASKILTWPMYQVFARKHLLKLLHRLVAGRISSNSSMVFNLVASKASTAHD